MTKTTKTMTAKRGAASEVRCLWHGAAAKEALADVRAFLLALPDEQQDREAAAVQGLRALTIYIDCERSWLRVERAIERGDRRAPAKVLAFSEGERR